MAITEMICCCFFWLPVVYDWVNNAEEETEILDFWVGFGYILEVKFISGRTNSDFIRINLTH